MASTVSERNRRIRRISYVAVGAWMFVALACCVSYQLDSAELRKAALEMTRGARTPAERVVRVLRSVHDRTDSRQSDSYFAWRGLGATPVQVLERGGDCTDKSRLMCALLREVDVAATPALCFDERTKEPTHTVVEADFGQGRFMVVDPAFGLFFPANEGGYYDLLDIRGDPSIVDRRVEEIYASLPSPGEHDRYYLRSSASYEFVSTFNWQKNPLTRFAFLVFQAVYGESIHRLPRPILWEEPKLFVASLSLGLAALCWAIGRAIPGAITRAVDDGCSFSNDGIREPVSAGGDVGVSVGK